MSKRAAVCVDRLKKWEHRRLNKYWKRVAREEYREEQREHSLPARMRKAA
jgi:hypothetical protein